MPQGSAVFQQGQEFLLNAFGGGVVRCDHKDGVVPGDGAHHFWPLLVIQRDGDGVGVAGRGFENHLVLCAQHVAQEFRGQQRECRSGVLLRHLLVAFPRLDEAQVADVARQRHLRGGNALTLQLPREFFLGGNVLAADQLQDLALTIAFGHTINFPSVSLARASAWATAVYPVPPGTSRDFIPLAGLSSATKSAVNSGAKRCISSAVQSAGLLPAFTLSSTKRPTIWCAWWNGVPARASASARSVATTQLSSAAAAGRVGLSLVESITLDIISSESETWSAASNRGILSSCMSRL